MNKQDLTLKHKQLKTEAAKHFGNSKNIVCPAFPKEPIYFNSKGLRHLFYTGANRPRPLDEVETRVKLLERAIKLIKLMPICQEEDFIIREEIKIVFWAFEGVVEDKRIKVIIRCRGNGKKHFWSVYPAWRKSKFGERRNSRNNLSND